MYKDKDKQRKAAREAQRRYKAKQQGITEGITSDRVLPQGITKVLPADMDKTLLAKRYPSLTVMERLFYRPASELNPGEHNFVSLPGRACYVMEFISMLSKQLTPPPPSTDGTLREGNDSYSPHSILKSDSKKGLDIPS